LSAGVVRWLERVDGGGNSPGVVLLPGSPLVRTVMALAAGSLDRQQGRRLKMPGAGIDRVGY